MENTDKVFHFVVPARPTDLSDEDLGKVSGGGFCEGITTPCILDGLLVGEPIPPIDLDRKRS